MYGSIMLQNQHFSPKRSAGFLSSFRQNSRFPFETRYLQVHLKSIEISDSHSLFDFESIDHPENHIQKFNSQQKGCSNTSFNDYMLPIQNIKSVAKSSLLGIMPSKDFSLDNNTYEANEQSTGITPLFLGNNNSRFLFPKPTVLSGFLHWKTAFATLNPQKTLFSEPVIQDEQASNELKSWMRSFGAGFCAGTIARTSTAPFDRLKFIYQLYYKGMEKPPSLLTGFNDIYKKEGIRGLFKGNLVCILKASPESAIRLTVFEKLKSIIKNEGVPNLDRKKLFIAGGLSGAVANLAIFPMDVLRTRLAADKNGLYKGVVDAIRKIVKTEGSIRPFYRGANAAIIANVPTSGLNLMLYETMKEIVTPQEAQKSSPAVLYMGLGGVSALITCSMMFPLQLVTSRMIMRGVLDKESASKGMLHQVRKIYHFEGMRGFYKGYCPGTSKVILGNAMLFGCYEFMKRTFGIEFKKH